MKSIYITIFLVVLTSMSWAANLTAISTSTGTGIKTGKINLTITGGFAPYAILWTGPGGYSSSKINPDSLAAGNYCVTVTDQYCGVAKLCVTVSEQGSSINEMALEQTKIYPNPFSNRLSIELPAAMKGQKINAKLYDQMGRTVAQEAFVSTDKIDWQLKEELSAGLYTIVVTAENGVQITRQLCTMGK